MSRGLYGCEDASRVKVSKLKSHPNMPSSKQSLGARCAFDDASRRRCDPCCQRIAGEQKGDGAIGSASKLDWAPPFAKTDLLFD